MKRWLRIFALLFALASPLVTLAQTHQEGIVSALRDQGYDEIEIRRTLLGRVRIQANREDGRREIVINPQSGLILRDYVFRRNSRSFGLSELFGKRRLGDDADDRDVGGRATAGGGETPPEGSPAIPADNGSSANGESELEEANDQSEIQSESD